jgi:L-lactate dehydrogenase (cytochrome)
MRENHSAFHKIWFRPKILVDVEKVDMSTTMLGTKTSMPFYVTATALGKLGNPEGEVVLTRGAKKHGVIQMIPTLASCSFDEIMDAAEGDQVQWLQLYVCSPSFKDSYSALTCTLTGQQEQRDYEPHHRAR